MNDRGSSNVVRMDDFDKSRSRLSPQESIRLLNDSRDQMQEHLSAATPNLFNKIDDILFDLANNVSDDSARSRYFNVMTELRLKKAEVSANFLKYCVDGFNKKARHDGAAEPEFDLGTMELELKLVEEDDLEESLAVKNAVSAIANACHEELFALDRRMEVLLRRPELDTEDNPLGPDVVCAAFKLACEKLESDSRAKLVIFKSFERILGPNLKEVYQEVNQHLLEKGILPKIRSGIRHQVPRGPATAGKAPGAGLPADDQGSPEAYSGTDTQDVFGAIQQLMGTPAMGGAGSAGGGPMVTPAQTQQILRALTRIQQGDIASVLSEAPAFDPASLTTGHVNVLRDLKSTSFVEGMGDTDILTLDVVSMLFDFILDDKNIPAAMKALIGRLQIPVLKAAMLDKSIFSKRTHPVRKLLDTLAQAGLGWDEKHGQEDPLYQQVEGIVHRLLEDFQDDIGLFQELLGGLQDFLAAQETEAEERAGASADAIEGRERLAMAAAMANDEVRRRLDEEGVPESVRDFLRHHWRELLSLTYLKDGDSSGEWHAAVETMDLLIDSVSPKPTPDERRQLLSTLPGLLKRLKEGVRLLSVADAERDRFLSSLAAMHAAVVRTGSPQPQPAGTATTQPAGADSLAHTDAVPEENTAGAGTQDEAGQRTELFRLAFNKANDAIYKAAQNRPECTGMGTTLVATLFFGDRITIAHVGDSRLYRLRKGQIEQVTKDHSLLQRLIDQGFYTPEEASQSNNKNYVTRAMGVEAEVEVELQQEPVLPGDTYLMCSDGLSDLVAPETMQSVLQDNGGDFKTAADTLVRLANEAGGKDNISVVLARVSNPPPAGERGNAPVTLADGLEIHGVSDVGIKRSHNEDYIGTDLDIRLAVLCDGMGGYNAGEVASALAVNTIMDHLRKSLGLAGKTDESGVEDSAIVEEILLGDDRDEGKLPEISDEYTELVSQLQVGTWIEFRRGDDTVKRAQLTWISPSGSAFLFTDRQGAKVADATPTGLAVELRRGTAAVIGDVPLFDRAVNSVMTHLKESTPAPA